MPACRSKAAALDAAIRSGLPAAFLFVVALLLSPPPAVAQTASQPIGAPIRLTPPPAPAPSGGAPAAAAVGSAPQHSGPPLAESPLAPLDPDWAGPLTPEQGGFATTLWQGTPRGFVAALLPRLSPTTSPSLGRLARRLLLSNAVAPEGPEDGAAADLLTLRAERLVALGQLDGAAQILALAPDRDAGEARARLAVDRAFLAGDDKNACGQIDQDVRRFQGVWWSRALIACQAIAGDTGKVSLGLELLREQKAPRDAAFDELIAAVGGRKINLDRLPDASPLDLALLAAAKLPLPEDAFASAGPAALARWAANETAPPAQRLAAAERAASFGAFPIDKLRALYAAAAPTPEDHANALTRAAAAKGPEAHALLYAAAAAATAPPAQAEILATLLARARKEGDLPLIAQVVAPMLTQLKPSPELSFLSGDATRALFLTDHPGEARAFLAAGDPAAAGTLPAIARLALGHDSPNWDPKTRDAILAGLTKSAGDGGTRRAALLLALLGAFDEEAGPAQWAPLAGALPLTPLDLPGPAIWFELPRAAAAKRMGETVLLALVTLGEDGKLTAQPARLVPAITALRAVGLEADARAIAVEAAIAAGL